MERRRVFIIGGGSSLVDFPFADLANKDTIAVNMSAFDVPNPTYCITGDSGIFRKLQEGYFVDIKTTWVVVLNRNHPNMLWKDGGLKHRISGFVYDLSCVDLLINHTQIEGLGFSFSDFRTGYNSGFCAFQLAVLLGYDEIHLLGFDLCRNANETHYHNKYRGRCTISDNAFEKFYDNFVLALKIVKEKTDIEVISHSSISRLNKHITYQPFGDL